MEIGNMEADLIALPAWAGILIALAATVTAIGVLWRLLVTPFYRIVKHADDMLPVLNDLTRAMKDSPAAFLILKDIIAQFRTDSGSSLRDVINRLEDAAKKNRQSSEEMLVALKVSKELAEQDRRQLERLITLVNILNASVSASGKGVHRLEQGAKLVLSDLQESRERADEIESTEFGAAADAASRSAPEPKK